MSELTLFKSGALLPDYLREGTDELTKRLAGTSGGKSISTEGGVFRMIVGGDEIAKNEDRGMNVVIVNAAQHIARAYYVGTYVKGESSSPVCASGDGKVPDASIKEPQSNACATCPQNIAGSGLGESRACRFNQRFAVVLENDLAGNVYRLQLPATSLFGKAEGNKMPLQAYAKFLQGHGVPMSGIVTEARFDTSASVAVLKFSAVRPLTREELTVARAQGARRAAVADLQHAAANGGGAAVALVAAQDGGARTALGEVACTADHATVSACAATGVEAGGKAVAVDVGVAADALRAGQGDDALCAQAGGVAHAADAQCRAAVEGDAVAAAASPSGVPE